MPEYFFHVSLELSADASLSPAPELSPYFRALKPFTGPSDARRTSRDHLFNHRLPQPQPHPAPSPNVSAVNSRAGSNLPFTKSDHRYDRIRVESLEMTPKNKDNAMSEEESISKGIGTTMSGPQTRGRYEAIGDEEVSAGWGVVHLYRDAEETSGLYKDSALRSKEPGMDSAVKKPASKPYPPPKDDDCTMLCILAVPSYMSPSDFLAFVGEETCAKVSHFRMIKTARANRYMVLIKFKNGKQARAWQHEWDGKVFNSMEVGLPYTTIYCNTDILQPETCHVVFLKSVEIILPDTCDHHDSQPSVSSLASTRMLHEPMASTTSAKPPAPRTPALVELPTCPVCLERMDETSGLLTILCQHVFHCTCLQKWSGGGCPVCRYTHDDFSSKSRTQPYKKLSENEYVLAGEPLACEVCHVNNSLWQCLICGCVGCGRYEGKHAFRHYEETGHTFSMDLVDKRVWDYSLDGYVHRIVAHATKPGEKLVELPGHGQEHTALEANEDVEMIKRENMSLEYTHLLSSQLESQREYFEAIVERATNKAAETTKKLERTIEETQSRTAEIEAFCAEHDTAKDKLSELETENRRLQKRHAELEKKFKGIGQKHSDEMAVAKGYYGRIQHQDMEIKQLKDKIVLLEGENATKDLLLEASQEEIQDLTMRIMGESKLRELVNSGELTQEELATATYTTGPSKAEMTQSYAERAREKARQALRGAEAQRKAVQGEALLIAAEARRKSMIQSEEGPQDAGADGNMAASGLEDQHHGQEDQQLVVKAKSKKKKKKSKGKA